ncbi:MAG: hypothetical protein NVS9B4_00830 [Candidatus Acidiferrum sp.]
MTNREIVAGVRAREPASCAALYAMIQGDRKFAMNRCQSARESSEVDDRLHDTYRIAATAIEAGAIKRPECLQTYLHSVLRFRSKEIYAAFKRASNYTHQSLARRPAPPTPEALANQSQRHGILLDMIRHLATTHWQWAEVMTRSIILDHDDERIQREMGLASIHAVELIRSRAKALLMIDSAFRRPLEN